MIRGVDVSNNQGRIDWQALAGDPAGYSFAFIKASEGLTFTDAHYARNRREANKAGLRVGAYHYGRPGADPIAQAERFAHIASPRPGDLRPVLDIEETDGESSAHVRRWTLAFLREATLEFGVRPFVYLSPGFAASHSFGAEPRLRRFPLWVAHWRAKAPMIPAPWKRAVVWQHSASGTVAGVVGRCDLDRWLEPCDPLACWAIRDA